jgi:Pyruvate/2-oxoacid:ferredoxin oxidoreductase delta subunit
VVDQTDQRRLEDVGIVWRQRIRVPIRQHCYDFLRLLRFSHGEYANPRFKLCSHKTWLKTHEGRVIGNCKQCWNCNHVLIDILDSHGMQIVGDRVSGLRIFKRDHCKGCGSENAVCNKPSGRRPRLFSRVIAGLSYYSLPFHTIQIGFFLSFRS